MEQYQKILQFLLTIPGSVKVNDNQIRMHCPVCNNKNNKLYVGLSHNPVFIGKGLKVLGYGCKHCLFSGNVGKKFYDTLGIKVDKDLMPTQTIKSGVLKNINTITKYETMNLKIPDFIRPEDEFKMDYLSKRFNRKLTMKDIQTYKIVLNVQDLYDFNNLSIYQFIDPNDKKAKMSIKYLIEEFSKHFVGMLSVDNNKINLRNIDSEKLKSKRYMVHVINKNIGNPYLYIPSTKIDLLTPNPIICLAEGNYDIIGAKELYYLEDRTDVIFAAIGTRTAYKRALTQIMKMTGFINAQVHIFADNDNDTNLQWYVDMFKEWRHLFDTIHIHYNIANDANGKPCKDFGNLSNPVELKTYDI